MSIVALIELYRHDPHISNDIFRQMIIERTGYEETEADRQEAAFQKLALAVAQADNANRSKRLTGSEFEELTLTERPLHKWEANTRINAEDDSLICSECGVGITECGASSASWYCP